MTTWTNPSGREFDNAEDAWIALVHEYSTERTARERLIECIAQESHAVGISERLIECIAQESHAVGISETMTPEGRVRAMRVAVERVTRERDAALTREAAMAERMREIARAILAANAPDYDPSGTGRSARETIAGLANAILTAAGEG
jgi:hypothetical protein